MRQVSQWPRCTILSYIYAKKSKHRLHDPVLQVTIQDHATYPSTFLTYLYRAPEKGLQVVGTRFREMSACPCLAVAWQNMHTFSGATVQLGPVEHYGPYCIFDHISDDVMIIRLHCSLFSRLPVGWNHPFPCRQVQCARVNAGGWEAGGRERGELR